AKTCGCLRSAPTASPSLNGSATTKDYSQVAHASSLPNGGGDVVGRSPDDRDRKNGSPPHSRRAWFLLTLVHGQQVPRARRRVARSPSQWCRTSRGSTA